MSDLCFTLKVALFHIFINEQLPERFALAGQRRTAQADSGMAGSQRLFYHGRHLCPSGLHVEAFLGAGDGGRYFSAAGGSLRKPVGFEPTRPCGLPDFECCKTLADSRLKQVVTGSLVKCRKPRRRNGLRTFQPVSARADLNQPRVQIKPRSCVKSLRSCAFARNQARKQRPQQRQ